MNPRLFAPAGGLFVLVTCALATAGAATRVAGQAPAGGQPPFVNAKVETRAVGSSLTQAVDGIVRAQTAGPSWFGYSVPTVPGDHHLCDSDRPSRAYLEGRPRGRFTDDRELSSSGDSRDMAILFRAAAGKIQKVRVFSTSCELDGGGLPVVWLTGVRPAESVALLRVMVSREDQLSEASEQSSLTALALHADPSAEQALESFAAAGQPTAVRKRAAFWLGAARGDEGFRALQRLLRAETDNAFRRELVFPISLGRTAESADVLIQLARSDASAEVRKQAMFWLGQKAGSRAAATLSEATVSDPDTDVKKRAVFALSRMPANEGVPRLIEVARTNRNPEVRRQAMFWLGQSDDARALAYLEEVLKR